MLEIGNEVDAVCRYCGDTTLHWEEAKFKNRHIWLLIDSCGRKHKCDAGRLFVKVRDMQSKLEKADKRIVELENTLTFIKRAYIRDPDITYAIEHTLEP